jgi:hypothetical protein
VKNTASTDLVLDIMARNEGASSFAKSALGRTVIKAGEELPLAVALQRQAGSRALHLAYLQMSGRPNGHFRHWHTFDPARVQDLVITSAQAGNHSFTIGRLFPVEETDESLAEVLPILDCYGQSLQRTWRGKVYSDNDIKAKTEVEDALMKTGAFRQVAAIGLPDEWLGQRLCAVAVGAHEAADVDAVLKAVAADLPAHMVPARVDLVAALPTTPNGKVDYKLLVAERSA